MTSGDISLDYMNVEKVRGIAPDLFCSTKRVAEQVEKFEKIENKKLSEDINYEEIKGLRIEARQKLKEVRPKTIAQAIRISGVNPSDISVLSVYLKKEYNNHE